ncbi:MAG: GntR family transcriptional regulator [Bacteroidales bacterium]|nr:GntR family transcriptional regulator [Bacteroidales bacterium]
MPIKLHLDNNSHVPVYKQIMDEVENAIKTGVCNTGDILPSMNELAADLEVSKETVKKAYFLLRDKGIISSTQGKGYYIAEQSENRRLRILMLFDKLSNTKQVLFNSFASTIDGKADITIYLHNQQINLLEYYIDENLGNFDYYVITPHFPLDTQIQKRVLKALRRIPNRKLILLDHDLDKHTGNYGAVYQDYMNDAYTGLSMGMDKFSQISKLNVIIETSSLYHKYVVKAVERFCDENKIECTLYNQVTPGIVHPGEVYLIINGQLDMELINLVRAAKSLDLKPGRDFSIISYNESPINEIILDGLTTISSDFCQMGRVAAEMILDGTLRKFKCDFRMTRRSTF